MGRTAFFVDGFNLFHSFDSEPAYHKYKWLNLAKLSQCFIGSKDTLSDVFYFTTYTTWDPRKLAKHQNYVKALYLVGVKAIFGEFRNIERICRICRKSYRTFEEKRTDVNIAIHLFQTAVADTWDKAIIISGDSDLIPAVEAVQKTFPSKQVGIVIPIRRRAEELKQVADFYIKLKERHLETCQFDDVIKIDHQQILKRPETWR